MAKPTTKTIILLFFLLMTIAARMDINGAYTVPLAAYTVCAGDIDLDGDVDIVTGHNVAKNWSGISYLKNSNNGYFALTDSLYFFGWQYVHIAQLDNDPHPEILFKKENSSTEFIGILFNNNFWDTLFLDTHSYQGIEFITTGDIDNNGFNDIIFASNQGQFWSIFYNYGNMKFSSPEYHYVTGSYPTGIACEDLNADGRKDVVICGHSTEVWFSYPGNFQKLALESAEVVWITDFDNNGKNDILTFVNNPFGNWTSLIIYRNIGNNAFQKIPEFYFSVNSSEFFVADFNTDSLPDVLFQLYDKSGYVIEYNQGNFHLHDSAFISVEYYGEHWRNCYCADFDGNGFIDIVTVRTSGVALPSNLDIKFNDGQGHFVDHPCAAKGESNKNVVHLFGNFPNPFTNHTTIEFYLTETAFIDLSIYDMNGNLIICLIDQRTKAGLNHTMWDRVGSSGKICSDGMYFAILKTSNNMFGIIKLLTYQ